MMKTETHFPSALNQCRKFLQRGDIYFLKAERAYKKTQLTVKPDSSGFWTFCQAQVPSPVPFDPIPNPEQSKSKSKSNWDWGDTIITWATTPITFNHARSRTWVVQHVQGEGYQQPITSRTGSSQVPKDLIMTPLYPSRLLDLKDDKL